MKAASEVIEVDREELKVLLERARREPLDEADCQKLQDASAGLQLSGRFDR